MIAEGKFLPFPELKDEEILLRSLEYSDSSDILSLRSDPEVNRYIQRIPTASLEDAENFIKKIKAGLVDGSSILWVISARQSGEFMGTICLWNFSPEENTAELGYELIPDFQNKGIMSRAVDLVLDYGFAIYF